MSVIISVSDADSYYYADRYIDRHSRVTHDIPEDQDDEVTIEFLAALIRDHQNTPELVAIRNCRPQLLHSKEFNTIIISGRHLMISVICVVEQIHITPQMRRMARVIDPFEIRF